MVCKTSTCSYLSPPAAAPPPFETILWAAIGSDAKGTGAVPNAQKYSLLPTSYVSSEREWGRFDVGNRIPFGSDPSPRSHPVPSLVNTRASLESSRKPV